VVKKSMPKLYNLDKEVVPGRLMGYTFSVLNDAIPGSAIAGEDVEQFNLVYQKGGKIFRCTREKPETAIPIALTLHPAKAGEDCGLFYYGSIYCEELDLPIGMPLWTSKNPGLIDVGAASTEPGDFHINVGACISKHEFFFYSRYFESGPAKFEMKYVVQHLWSAAIIPGQFYQHYKKFGTEDGVYGVIAVGKHTETGEVNIVYMGQDGRVWIRPEEVFLSEPSEGVPRFLLLDDGYEEEDEEDDENAVLRRSNPTMFEKD
jgi:hypothetical protein